MTPDEGYAALRDRAQLATLNVGGRAIDRLIADGSAVRVATGRYVTSEFWSRLFAEDRHLLAVLAATERSRTDAAAVLTSAAVLHQLPLWRHTPTHVHLAAPSFNGQLRDSPDVAHHRWRVKDADTVRISGILCTSLARTVADLLRYLDPVAGLAAADAALRSVAWNPRTRTYHASLAEELRLIIASKIRPGSRGAKTARWVLNLADGRSESPGESASRMLLIQLGFAPPQLQVPVAGPDGRPYFVDFGLDEVEAWGEYDGTSKYLDPEIRGGALTLEEAILNEKTREDWIRGTTHRRFGRWGTEHLTLPLLERRLRSFQILPRR